MKKFVLTSVFLLIVLASISAQTHEKRNFQLSLISPLGTNGMQSHLITNKVSFNVLGGYSYGNTAFEFGGLYNINTHLTQGFQFAGISNYSGNSENTVQFSGVNNISKDGLVVTQFSGVSNIAKEVSGVQFAGVSNVATEVSGLQFSGVSNIAKEVSGVQFAGVANIAKKVRGVQVGLINYSEENDGVSIGLVNIVKNGGKKEFEVSFSEALNTAISFRLGTDKFYTIFSGGINYINSPTEYAAGLGFGSHINWKDGWGNQIELMGYNLTENGSFDLNGINMLTQLRFIVSKELDDHFKVFVGPVLNMTISEYVNPETGALGSTLPPSWSMWKNNSDNIRLESWIGFTAGVRF